MNRIMFDEESESDAAEAAVAGLNNIMDDNSEKASAASASKRKRDYATAKSTNDSPSKKTKEITSERREERNLREKERSLKITQQIHELRELLSTGGVIVPKGTKSTILAEAANYIRLLQQTQYNSEMDRAQLIHEVQRIGNGAIGPHSAVAIRHVANQNGVSSVANFEEMPALLKSNPQTKSSNPNDFMSDNLTDTQYRCVFNSISVGMAIATMGGSFIDCNSAFTKLSSYTKQELKATTIFNLTSREDLQGAFDMMSQLITPSNFDGHVNRPPVILRSSIKHRNDIGMSVSLIRGDDGVARYFNVTLVEMSEFGNKKPIPASVDISSEAFAQFPRQPTDGPHQMTDKSIAQEQSINSPRYTSG